MRGIEKLVLTDFRNYQQFFLTFRSKNIIFVGANGAGKTNVLEAISLLSPGRGFRRAKLSEMLRQGGGSSWAIAAQVATSSVPMDIGCSYVSPPVGEGEKRFVQINGVPVKAHTDLRDYLTLSWLIPQMDRLFIEGAGHRRRFFDRLVYGFDPLHAKRVSTYEHAVRERNILLRKSTSKAWDVSWLNALEDTIAHKGIDIVQERQRLIDLLNEGQRASTTTCFPQARLSLVGRVEELFHRQGSLDSVKAFRGMLEQNRFIDAQASATTLGPHKADVEVYHCLNQQEAGLCSTGEQKALLISIMLTHAQFMAKKQEDTVTILLLDEVMAHLDEKRREALFDHIDALPLQTFFTGTDLSLFSMAKGRAECFVVEKGRATLVNA